MPYQKMYSALRVIELEFDKTLSTFAYQAVLRVCSNDASEPAARMALRILDGLRVCSLSCRHPGPVTFRSVLLEVRCYPDLGSFEAASVYNIATSTPWQFE